MGTAIITGANGFIGARLTRQLLLNGWCVHALGRAKGRISYTDRMNAALDDIGGQPVPPHVLQTLRCHEVDFCEPSLGLTSRESRHLPGEGAVLFHAAGDTRFAPPDPEPQYRLNVHGAVNVVRALSESLNSVLHVSTAYVAGDRQGRVMEGELEAGQHFHNCYERSKLHAEIAISDTCRDIGLPLTIVRPSIVINDTATGRASTFTHLNALVEVVSRIQKHYGLRDGEAVSEVIRLPFTPDARPNLAPVDPTVAAILKIGTNSQCAGRTFHLCHPEPQPNSEILSLVAEAFGVRGKIRLPFVSQLPEDLSWTEKMMARSLKPYLPYMNEASVFDLTNTRSVIPDYDLRFPPVTLDYLRKVIEFQRRQERARLGP